MIVKKIKFPGVSLKILTLDDLSPTLKCIDFK